MLVFWPFRKSGPGLWSLYWLVWSIPRLQLEAVCVPFLLPLKKPLSAAGCRSWAFPLPLLQCCRPVNHFFLIFLLQRPPHWYKGGRSIWKGGGKSFTQPQSRMGELVLHSKLSSAFNSSLLTKHGGGGTSLSTTKPSSFQSRELFPSSRARGTSMNSHLEGHLPSAKECILNLRSHFNHQLFMVGFHGFQDK